MTQDTILLRVVDGTWEGWKWMGLNDFLEQISIEEWSVHQALVGMVLPAAPRDISRRAR